MKPKTAAAKTAALEIASWGVVKHAVFPTLNPKLKTQPIRLLDSEFRLYAVLFKEQQFRALLRTALDGVGISVIVDEPEMPESDASYNHRLFIRRRTRAFIEFAATMGNCEVVHRKSTGETTLFKLTGQLRSHIATVEGLEYADLKTMASEVGSLNIVEPAGCRCSCGHPIKSKAGSSEVRDSVEPSVALQRCPTLIGERISSPLFTEDRQRSQVCEPLPVPASTPKPVCEDNDQ